MNAAAYRLIAFAFAIGFSAPVWPRDLAGQWDLKIEDQNHRTIAVLVIEFTEHPARSCIAGSWLRVNVVAATTEDTHFFPVSDPLSYSVTNNKLTVGRNEICDAYLSLHGTLNDEIVRGEYVSFGWGYKPLGFFVLSPRSP